MLKQLEAEEVFNRALDTNGVPYHSPELDPLLNELRTCTTARALILQCAHAFVPSSTIVPVHPCT